jgi:hypothetical protein
LNWICFGADQAKTTMMMQTPVGLIDFGGMNRRLKGRRAMTEFLVALPVSGGVSMTRNWIQD